MIDNPNVAFIGGICIGIALMFSIGLIIYVIWDIRRKYKELIKLIKNKKEKN